MNSRSAVSLCLALAASALLFVGLFFGQVDSRQKRVLCHYASYCDYRVFMLPCMTSRTPYCPQGIQSFDACYPPIAYCVASLLSLDKGRTWLPEGREWIYLGSIIVSELLGLGLLLSFCHRGRLLAALSLLLSPALTASVLRGNPSGWAFFWVCMFLYAHRKDDSRWRILSAISLGIAVSLKLTPAVFGFLYLSGRVSKPSQWPWKEMSIVVATSLFMVFVPFLFFGGLESIPKWIMNAVGNARQYSIQEPIWGFVAILNRLDPSWETPKLANMAACLTNVTAVAFTGLAICVRQNYLRLICLGVVMVLLTHHDYGAAYLIPAFLAWLQEEQESERFGGNVIVVLEWGSWFLIFTPLQIPDMDNKSLNLALQGEALFVLMATAVFRGLHWPLELAAMKTSPTDGGRTNEA